MSSGDSCDNSVGAMRQTTGHMAAWALYDTCSGSLTPGTQLWRQLSASCGTPHSS